ncbi:Uma2 family endonuclease [Coleofasciculus sp. E2-BRE-01]|uniref:Uma2 family endonuclease n=1 Tax=Coleofasciculus sp. E2-BRE-01 TaxID=3069524 RepID=UPI0032F0DF5B
MRINHQTTATQALTLEEFLNLPETQPPSEFINGDIIQKHTPQGQHSLIQIELCKAIDRVAKPNKIAKAFPELRCTFGGDSIIPDIAVFRWARIPIEPSGKIANRFEIHPDWAIEILSPDQRQTKVLSNLLHCSRHGTEFGWLIDPEVESILVIDSTQRVELLSGTSRLPILREIELELTVDQVFDWLTLG